LHEQDASAVLLEGDSLADDFVTLRTGLAGAVLQKFGNYMVKAAVVLRIKQDFPLRFQELVAELNQGSAFRIFTSIEEALNWLVM
jgi:uncharacterized membrane protein